MQFRTAVVTGAGSGVGRAVALSLVSEGWSVVILGRRIDALNETRSLALSDAGGRIFPIACDVGRPAEVERMAGEATESLGGDVAVLVNAAGTNTPRRSLEVLSGEDYRRLIDVNLNGTFYCAQAFLPGMRRRGSGTIVNIVSDAGLIANAKAGPAYVASKFAVAGLTQSINAEERGNGIRACAICPGDIDTPILERRPVPPPPEVRAKMLRAEDVAACVMLAINLPERAVIEQLVIRPR